MADQPKIKTCPGGIGEEKENSHIWFSPRGLRLAGRPTATGEDLERNKGDDKAFALG